MMLLTGTSHTLADPAPTFAALRHPGFDCMLDVTFTFNAIKPGDEAGLALRLSSMFNVTCTVGLDKVLTLTQHVEDIHHIISRVQLAEDVIQLKVVSDREKYSFYYQQGGEYHLLGQASTRFLSVEIAGKCFVGVVLGLYATSRENTGAVMAVTNFSLKEGVEQ